MSINQLYENIKKEVLDETLWVGYATSILLIILIVAVSKISVTISHKSIDKIIMQRMKNRHPNQERRINTIGKLLKNTISYTIYFIMTLLILGELGVSLGPLLAGAGIAGIAIGFGAQSIVKDVITGFFIVLEDQFAVGDTVQTGTYKGVVEVIGLRTTRLVSENGEVHIIPNSAINQVTNFSLNKAKLELKVELEASNWDEHRIYQLKDVLMQFEHPMLEGKLHVVVNTAITGKQYQLKLYGHCNYTDKEEFTVVVYDYIASYVKK